MQGTLGKMRCGHLGYEGVANRLVIGNPLPIPLYKSFQTPFLSLGPVKNRLAIVPWQLQHTKLYIFRNVLTFSKVIFLKRKFVKKIKESFGIFYISKWNILN